MTNRPRKSPTAYERVDYALAARCLTGLLLTHIAGAIYLGGDLYSVGIGVVILTGVAVFALLNGRVPGRYLQYFALFGIVGGAASTNVVFPVGGDSVVYVITAALVVFWEVRSRRVAYGLIGCLFAAPLVAYGLGHVEGLAAPAPQWLSVGVAATWATVYAALSMSRARGAYTEAHARLSATETRIAREVTLLREQQEAQAATNTRRERQAAALAARVERERAATQRLRDALGDREQLATAIRHDLREPLRNITSFSQLLRRRLTRDLPEGKAADYLAFAEDGGRRMAVMVDDLLRYTQSDHAEELVAVDLAAVVTEVRLNLADQFERTGAALTATDLPVLSGYPTQVYQLLQNIVSNAIKFARPGVPPAIAITASAVADGRVTVSIADNGRGIPANQLQDVFGLFNRSGNVGEVEGTGVGLALCRRIAIAHGGGLTVTSVAGEGSTFHFTCPVSEAAPVAPREARDAQRTPSTA